MCVCWGVGGEGRGFQLQLTGEWEMCVCVCVSEGGGGVNARNVKGTRWTETPQGLAVLTGISNEVPVQRTETVPLG